VDGSRDDARSQALILAAGIDQDGSLSHGRRRLRRRESVESLPRIVQHVGDGPALDTGSDFHAADDARDVKRR
jgi:hypothetical protein